MSSAKSGVGIIAKHSTGTDVYAIQLGLQHISDQYTEDGMPFGFMSVALNHLVAFIAGFMPDTVKISATFPRFVLDDNGNIVETIHSPYISVKGNLGPSRELGMGRLLWETPDGYVKGFNQIVYFEVDVFDKTIMKCDQIADQVALQTQIEKGVGGILHRLGFQNFRIISSEAARAFRFDYPWDFRQMHQYVRLFHTRLILRTEFDVVWEDRSEVRGVISQIVMGQTVDIPYSTVLGSSLGYLRLEENYWGFHSGIL